MVVLKLCDEDGHGDRDSIGDDLRTGQQHGCSFHGGDPDGDLAGFPFLHGADLVRPGNGDLVSGVVFLYGADDLARPRNKDVIGAALLHHHGGDAGVHQLSPELGRVRLLSGVRDGYAGEDPARRLEEDGDGGGELGTRVPPRNLVRAVLLHHQHGDEGLFPEPGRVQRFLDVGDGDGDAGGRAALGLWGRDAGGGEDLGGRLDADEACAAYRLLRLRGGAADYHSAAVPPSHSWVDVMGLPMVQTIPGTCALVAATVCVEAQHRREFEAVHGAETFACRAAAPRRLRQACFREKVWNPSTRQHERTWDPNKGAWSLGRVLHMMKRLGGARTTNAPPPAPFFLPLKDWESYGYEDGGLTAETAARLIYERGPCIGTLFATTQFFDTFVVPGSNTFPAVFRGCHRDDREEVKRDDPNASMHAVVCYAYCRSNRGRLCIFLVDNQRASGPIRCVDFEEFDEFYVLYVEALSPLHLLDFHRFPPLEYPVSSY